MDEDTNEMILPIELPPQANLQLPDPALCNYYKDLNNRIYWLRDTVSGDDITLIRFIMMCNMEDTGKPKEDRVPITIFIDSPGGSVEVMASIIGAIDASTTPVATVNICTAYSAAAEILASGHKGLRFALPFTSALFHPGSRDLSGTVAQVASAQKFFDNIGARIDKYVFDRTNFPKNIKAKIKKDDVFFTEEELLEYGVVDHIVHNYEECLAKYKVMGYSNGGKQQG